MLGRSVKSTGCFRIEALLCVFLMCAGFSTFDSAQVPSLFWVLVTLSVVVYVSALAMRATVLNLSGDYYGPGLLV